MVRTHRCVKRFVVVKTRRGVAVGSHRSTDSMSGHRVVVVHVVKRKFVIVIVSRQVGRRGALVRSGS